MADIYAVDSLAPVTQAKIDFLAKTVGSTPQWWGRYLGGIADNEARILEANGISLVPIARRSSLVVGNEAAGKKVGREDADQLLSLAKRFPKTCRRVFLDVEMAPTMTPEFYQGWAAEITGAWLEPAIYLPNAKNWGVQWQNLAKAMSKGAKCFGTWSAGYFFQSQKQTEAGTVIYSKREWDKSKAEGPVLAKALAWQYLGNAYGKQFDFNLLNPNEERWW